MSSEITRIGGAPVRSPEPDSGLDPSDLPDGTSLGDGKYVYQGKIVGITDLPDGQILSNGKIVHYFDEWGARECDIRELPTGTRLSNGQYVYREMEYQWHQAGGPSLYAEEGRMTDLADLPDGLWIGDHTYAWQGKAVGIGELPDGLVLRIGCREQFVFRGREVDFGELPEGQVILGWDVTRYKYKGMAVTRPPNGLLLSNGKYFYLDWPGNPPGREVDLEDLPKGIRLHGGPFDGKYVWNGRAVDFADLPDGTVIPYDTWEWGDGRDRYAWNGEMVRLADLPDGTQLSDGTWKYTVPGSDPPAAGACKTEDLSLYFPEGTRFSDGTYLYKGTPMRFIEMLLTFRLDGIEKAGRKFEEYYSKVKVTNDHIRVLNDIAERLGTLDPDEDSKGGFLGPPIEGLDENGNKVTLTVSQWIEKLGLEDAVRPGSLDLVDMDVPGGRATFIKWDKGMLDSFKEKIQAKIREFNNQNEEDMILLNQHNMDKQTIVQMYMSDVDKWIKSLPTVSP